MSITTKGNLSLINSVLIIDDDWDDREIFKDAINEIDPLIKVNEIGNCLDILMEIPRLPTMPEIIFLDINMPVVNGRDCLRVLQGHDQYKEIPVIMYSTSNGYRDISDTYEIGAMYYLQKPISFNNLVRLLKLILLRTLPIDGKKGIDEYFLNSRLGLLT
jgi:CheY-like chemotaxis protein